MDEIQNKSKQVKVFAIIKENEHVQQIIACLKGEDRYTLLGHVNSGLEGLEFCRKNTPDVVLVDRSIIDIDSIDPIDIVKQLMNIHPSTGIIMLSDTGDVDWIRKLLILGVGDFLQKPISKSELIPTLDHLSKSTPSN